MSLILDALNRSRRESEPVPGILTEHKVPQAPVKTYLLWLALACSGLLIAWLLLDRDTAEPVVPPQQSAVIALSDNVSSALTSVKTQLQTRTEQGAAKAQQASREASQDSAAIQEPLAQADASGAAAAPVQPAVPPVEPVSLVDSLADSSVDSVGAHKQQTQSKAEAERKNIAELYRQQASQPKVAARTAPSVRQETRATVTEEPVDVEKVLLAAREELENAKLVEHSAPFLSTLSQSLKDSIPTVLYQRHDYSSTAGESSVVLNSKKLREGGVPKAGMKIQEILPNSVVLEFRGTVFRLRALNSWVNL